MGNGSFVVNVSWRKSGKIEEEQDIIDALKTEIDDAVSSIDDVDVDEGSVEITKVSVTENV
jgi:hypothetical protein